VADHPPGTRIAGYRILSVLGRGGMGVVYKAQDEARARAVALKVMKRDLAFDERFLKRFQREAQAASAVAHPNVAATFLVGSHEGAPFLVLELVPGGTLKALIKARGALPWEEVVELGAGIARGLGAVHAAGLVHRDLKPENVLLDAAGRPKLTDFGLVRNDNAGLSQLTKTGEMVGTLEYMAPEQADTGTVDFRADLYSLGATLYHLLAGKPPFEGEGYGLVKKHLQETPAPVRAFAPAVPVALEALVLRLLEKRPDRRGESADQVAVELEAIASSGGAAPRGGKGLAVAIGVAAAVAVGILLATRGAPSAGPDTRSPPAKPVRQLVWSGDGRVMTGFDGQVRSDKGAFDLTAVLGSSVWNFPHEVSSVAVSPDGTRALVGDGRGTIHLLELPGGREVAFASGHTGWVSAVAFSPDGTLALSGDQGDHDRGIEGSIRLWEVKSRKLVWRVPAKSAVTCVAFSPDGNEALSCGGHDRAVRLWGVNDGRSRGELEGHQGDVLQAVFLALGAQVVSGSLDGTLRLWDRASKHEIGRMGEHGLGIHSLAVSEQAGRVLVLSGSTSDPGSRTTEVKLWDLATKKEIQAFHQENTACAVAFVPGTPYVIATENQPPAGLNVYDVRTGARVKRFAAGHSVYGVAVTPSGVALTAAGDQTVGVVDLRLMTDVRPGDSHHGPITALAGSAARARAITGGRDACVGLWSLDAAPGPLRPRFLMSGHQDGITGVALSRDGKRAVSVSWDRTIREWDLDAGTEREIRPTPPGPYDYSAPLRSVALSADGRFTLVGAEDGACLVLDRGMSGVQPLRGHSAAVTFVGFLSDERFVSASADGTVLLWPTLTGNDTRPSVTLDLRDRAPEAMAIDAAATFQTTILAGSHDGTVFVHDVDTVSPLPALAQHPKLTAVAVAPDGKRVLSGGADGTVRLSSPEGVELDRVDLGPGDDFPTKIVFTGARTVLVGTARGMVYAFALTGG
jgi:WD40 repeat protein